MAERKKVIAGSLIHEEALAERGCRAWLRLLRELFLNSFTGLYSASTPQLARCFDLFVVALVSLTLWAIVIAAPRSRLQQTLLPNHSLNSLSRSRAPQTEDADNLKRDETVRRTIRGGETHSFKLTLATNQCAKLLVEWKGIDLNVLVLKPDGKPLFAASEKVGGPGPAPVYVVADQPGIYTIQVRPFEQLLVTGSYELKLEDVRAQTTADENYLAAQEALVAAQQLKSKEEAAGKYEEAARLWQNAGDLFGQANALHGLADLYKTGGEFQKAVEKYNQVLAMWRTARNRKCEAYLLVDLGLVYQKFDSAEAALGFYNQALPIFQETGDRLGEALGLYSIGFAYGLMGKTQDAIKFYERALPVYRSEGNRLGEARTLNAVAFMYGRTVDSDKALEFYQAAADARRELDDRLGQAIALNNIGVIYDDRGDWQRARQNYEQALSIYKSLLENGWAACHDGTDKDKSVCGAAASSLDNIGELYNSLGDPKAALETFEQSLKIRESLKQPRGIGTTTTRICYAEFLEGQYEEAAKDCTKALGFNRQVKDDSGLASTLLILGMINSAQNQTQSALQYYDEALRLQKGTEDRRAQAITLDKMGEAYALARDMKSAFENYNLALSLWREVKDIDGESLTLGKIARAEMARGNLGEAHKRVEQAIALVESLRVKVTSQRLRTLYFASKVNLYELDVDLKMQLAKAGDRESRDNLVAAALQVNERARARSLLEMLAEDRLDIRQGAGLALSKLVERRSDIRRKLNAQMTALTNLLSGKPQKEQVDALAKEVDRLALEYDETEARIKTESPRYGSLTSPPLLNAGEIQRSLLDDNTLLLEYALGTQRSYLWVVSSTQVKGYELPGREEIESVARRLKKVLASGERLSGETASQYQARLLETEEAYRREATHLGRMLLAPAIAELGQKRLLIVAEGELQSIPFGALAKPLSKAGDERAPTVAPSTSGDVTPLLEEHEIVSLPSASTLASIRSTRLARNLPPKTVAVLADPVFERDDSRLPLPKRLKGSVGTRPKLPGQLEQTLKDFGPSLPRLSSSRREAQDILAIAPAGKRMEALDFEANHATATDPALKQYRIVHFATHGIFNDEYPELSGIVLSLYDKQGRPQEDGFLRLNDIYNLNLPVELVVLSACRTALGKNIRGEGLMGLTRGFIYAGAARVAASLWKVEDEATAELMKRFYEYMLKDRKSPAAALREAALSMRERARWRHPYFWAGFILQGEWK